DLLTMQSGVYDYTKDQWVTIALGLAPWMSFTEKNALNIIRRQPAQFEPGTKFQYSNSNYVLLGLILEKVTGKNVEDVITDDILRPLGMNETSFPTRSSMPAPYSHGYMPGLLFPTLLRDSTSVNP